MFNCKTSLHLLFPFKGKTFINWNKSLNFSIEKISSLRKPKSQLDFFSSLVYIRHFRLKNRASACTSGWRRSVNVFFSHSGWNGMALRKMQSGQASLVLDFFLSFLMMVSELCRTKQKRKEVVKEIGIFILSWSDIKMINYT